MKKLLLIAIVLIGIAFIPTHLTVYEPPLRLVVNEVYFPTPTPKITDCNLVVSEINQIRKEIGATLLGCSQTLQEGAYLRAYKLNTTGQWSHEGYIEDFNKLNQNYKVIGENLSKGYTDYEVVEAWMNSPLHKKIMLSSDFDMVGYSRYGNIAVLWLSEI